MRFYSREAIRRNTMKFDEFLRQQQVKEASPEYQARRTTYLQARNAELDRIAKYDAEYRERLKRQPDPDLDLGKMYFDERQLIHCEAFDLGISRRVLVNAAESFVLSCVEVSALTGKELVEKAATTGALIASLKHHEDDMNATFGPPWGEEPSGDGYQAGLFSRGDRVEERLDRLFASQIISIEA
jgi:hypothetical protein